MRNFTYFNITKIVFGRGVEEQAGKEAAKFGRKGAAALWRRPHCALRFEGEGGSFFA